MKTCMSIEQLHQKLKDEGGKGGGIDHVSRKIKQPFHNSQKYNISISRFTENKREHFGKSRFMAAMEIMIHKKKKKSHFTFHRK